MAGYIPTVIGSVTYGNTVLLNATVSATAGVIVNNFKGGYEAFIFTGGLFTFTASAPGYTTKVIPLNANNFQLQIQTYNIDLSTP